eukprot:CAMPEP_0183329512 /NCGR_PEP_ID=MMETSP0160_2-20130417/84832_1 /TAXON_ID=2839 ORGANISM="Odontella Sinensis, Strain Grunow 1884" /NCGR_SAMPLE_ID=MMETSP0160_2 /ASSEMBLY_ACC=CAM_ASM_000250 /LENGTH=178 /DNA_ID=CAMNT_0025497703 /DNA_START=90 /DNA_END=623 /DNA_ORIENTATION=-
MSNFHAPVQSANVPWYDGESEEEFDLSYLFPIVTQISDEYEAHSPLDCYRKCHGGSLDNDNQKDTVISGSFHDHYILSRKVNEGLGFTNWEAIHRNSKEICAVKIITQSKPPEEGKNPVREPMFPAHLFEDYKGIDDLRGEGLSDYFEDSRFTYIVTNPRKEDAAALHQGTVPSGQDW